MTRIIMKVDLVELSHYFMGAVMSGQTKFMPLKVVIWQPLLLAPPT